MIELQRIALNAVRHHVVLLIVGLGLVASSCGVVDAEGEPFYPDEIVWPLFSEPVYSSIRSLTSDATRMAMVSSSPFLRLAIVDTRTGTTDLEIPLEASPLIIAFDQSDEYLALVTVDGFDIVFSAYRVRDGVRTLLIRERTYDEIQNKYWQDLLLIATNAVAMEYDNNAESFTIYSYEEGVLKPNKIDLMSKRIEPDGKRIVLTSTMMDGQEYVSHRIIDQRYLYFRSSFMYDMVEHAVVTSDRIPVVTNSTDNRFVYCQLDLPTAVTKGITLTTSFYAFELKNEGLFIDRQFVGSLKTNGEVNSRYLGDLMVSASPQSNLYGVVVAESDYYSGKTVLLKNAQTGRIARALVDLTDRVELIWPPGVSNQVCVISANSISGVTLR